MIQRPDSPAEFDLLTPQEKEALKSWISNNLIARETFNANYTSYGLKHKFEASAQGFYVSNGAFKGAMLLCGFKVRSENTLNWVFNISQRSPALSQ